MTQFLSDEIERLENLIYPRVVLTSLANANYTATKNEINVTGVTDSNGNAEIFLPELGSWDIEVNNESGIKTGVVTVSTIGASYTLAISYATLIITGDIGDSIQITNGSYSQSGVVGNDGTCQFSVGIGTWTIAASNNGLTVTDTVSIDDSSTVVNKTIKLSTITVSTDANNSVSATNGTSTITGTADGNGDCILRVTIGTWTVTTSDGTVSATSDAISVAAHSSNYNVSIKLPYVTISGDVGNTITMTKGSVIQSGTIASDGTYTAKLEIGTWSIESAVSDNANIRVTDTLSVSTNGINYPLTLKLPTITVTTASNAAVVATKDNLTISGTANSNGTCVLKVTVGTWSVSATSEGSTKTDTVTLSTHSINENISLAFTQIYGVQWDGSSSTTLTRTDAAENFSNPTPYMSGISNYGSPFDNLMPWAGMTVSERTGGTMVAIPKFYYKLTQNGNAIKIQIADGPVSGFSVSPAHMNRGDGSGERDIVYIGRYHCGSNSNYKSATGQTPKNNITRSTARTGIHNLGTKIWQSDFAMRFTIWLLYIVEFANWNSQATIGYGCGNNSSVQAMGYTDSMPYHTGTTLSSRTTYGCSTQYRNIEGLWDNVYDWCDGSYNNNSGLNIILNPANFNDSSNGINVGMPTSGFPSALSVKVVDGTFPLFMPAGYNGNDSTYITDFWNFDSSYPCLFVGGNYYQYADRGLFCVSRFSASVANAGIGCRLMELP